MPEPDDDLSPTLAETARRRADLRDALVDVEQAISRPAVGREPEWTKGVVLRLEGLAHAIEEHVEITERRRGCTTRSRPRRLTWRPRSTGCARSIPSCATERRCCLTKLQTTAIGPAWPLDEARDDLQRLLGQIVRHRQLGSDLVWEAYNLDIGGIE